MPEQMIASRKTPRRLNRTASTHEIARYEQRKSLFERREQKFQEKKRQIRRESQIRSPLSPSTLAQLIKEDGKFDGEFDETTADLLEDPSRDQDVFEDMASMLQLSSLVYTFNELRNIIKAGGILVPASELSDKPFRVRLAHRAVQITVAVFAFFIWREMSTRDVTLREVVYDERTKLEVALSTLTIIMPLLVAILIENNKVGFMVRQQLEDKEFILDNEIGDETMSGRKHGVLKNKLSGDEFHSFFEKNLRFLAYDKEIASGLNILANQLAKRLGKDVVVWEFDDHFADKSLVYGITINRLSKTVTVVFRGSVSPADWRTNFTVFLDTIALPSWIKSHWRDRHGLTSESVHVHAGYKKYLFGDLKEVNPAMYDPALPTKCFQIQKTLKEIYAYEEDGVQVHKGFKLRVTGHSLGGALATLLSFELAASNWMTENQIPLPLTCITFAQPYVGAKDFREAYEHLEFNKRICILRVSADCDVVPASPPWLWPFEHVGVNFHLKTFRRNEIWISRKTCHSFLGNLSKDSGKLHNIVRYFEDVQRLERWYIEKVKDGVLETWNFSKLEKLIGFGFKLDRRTGRYFFSRVSESMSHMEDESIQRAAGDLIGSDDTEVSSDENQTMSPADEREEI